jgi:hypothetical protein
MLTQDCCQLKATQNMPQLVAAMEQNACPLAGLRRHNILTSMQTPVAVANQHWQREPSAPHYSYLRLQCHPAALSLHPP